MATAISKSNKDQEIFEYMESLSKDYFGKAFPGSTISIEPKPRCGKQGGHIVKVENNEKDSSNTTIKQYYVKPQDNFVLPSRSSIETSKLTDIDELFMYKILSNLNITPPVHFYVNQQNPTCLLIATADGDSLINEKFYTAADCSLNQLKSLTEENIILVHLIEIIFFLKDLMSNEKNYGWLFPSKRLLIIDFSINKNETTKVKPTAPLEMLRKPIKTMASLTISKYHQNFNDRNIEDKKPIAANAIKSLVDSFVECIDSAYETINNIICANPYAFDGDVQKNNLKLLKIVERTRARWDELLSSLKINK